MEMQGKTGIKFETSVPLVRRAGEPFPLRAWTWWTEHVIALMAQLPGSQGPWTTWTQSYRWLTWIVLDELQLQKLLRFVGESREEFGLDALHFEYHPITFGVIE